MDRDVRQDVIALVAAAKYGELVALDGIAAELAGDPARCCVVLRTLAATCADFVTAEGLRHAGGVLAAKGR